MSLGIPGSILGGNTMQVSVIIPTFGKAENLIDSILSLSNQKFPDTNFEVIVVDNNPEGKENTSTHELDQWACSWA